MTHTRRRTITSLIALLSLLLAMMAPAVALAATDDAANHDEAAESAEESETTAESEAPEEDAPQESASTDETEPPADDDEVSDDESDKSETSDSNAESNNAQSNHAQSNTAQSNSAGDGDKHCAGHDDADKIEGAGTYDLDDVAVTVSGSTVSVDGGAAELCVKAATDNSGLVSVDDDGSYTVDFTNNGGQTPAISYVAVYDVTPLENNDDGSAASVEVDVTVDTDVCEKVTYLVDGSGSDNVDTITITGTVYSDAGVELATETHTLNADGGFTTTVVGTPPPGDYTLEWEATAGDATDSGSIDFTVEDCDTAGDGVGDGGDDTEVVDVDTTIDTDVCEKVTYLVDGSGSDNVDTITITGTVYSDAGVELATETHTLNADGDFTTTVVGTPPPGDYTLEWEATAGDATDSGSIDFTVEDCDTAGDGGQAADDAVDKVEICHATAAPTNPYRLIEPAVEGVINGHADQHTGPVFASGMDNGEWGDIIPSFTYVDDNGDVQEFDGLNWDAEGQAAFDADCSVDDLAGAAPGLTVTKTADVDTVTFDGDGDDDSAQVTYTYTITNTGNVALELTAFDDDKIADIDLDDLDAVLDGALAVDGNVTVEYTATLTSDDFDDEGELTNVVTVTGLIEGANPDDADNSVTDTDDETISAIEEGDEPPIEVQPDFVIDVPEGDVICIGTDVTVEIEALLDGDDTVDVDDLELDLRSDLDLSEHGLDVDDLGFDEDGNFSATLSDLPLGTNVIDYQISLDGEAIDSSDISVTVINCPPAPEIPDDGEDDGDAPDVSPTVDLDVDLVCPDGTAGFVVTTTGTDVEVTEGLLAVAFSGSDTPFWSGDIELGEALDVAWPVGTDDLPLDEFTVWVAFGDVTSESMVLNADDLGRDCEDVLGEVIDRPDESDEDVTGDSPDTPDTDTDVEADADADADVVREDDEVLGVVLDDSDDDLGADQLARTGVTVLGLLAAGLLSLLAGAGLLRRRDDA